MGGTLDDRWTVRVYVNDEEVASETGFGDSIFFTFDYSENMLEEQTPTPAPVSECTPLDECCEDRDCNVDEVCVQRTCIDRGNPRFTLTWIGDDDLDLSVVTPMGTTVAASRREDEESGGVFGEDSDQLRFGMHVENIYFPQAGGPSGTYTYFVSSFFPNGPPDLWTLSVVVDDQEVASHMGTSSSSLFLFSCLLLQPAL